MSRSMIEPVGAAQAALLAALHATAFDEVWSAAAMTELLAMPGAFALLAEAAGEPQGFILCRSAGGECEILTLAVSPSARRQGVAASLLATACARAAREGASMVFLEVAADNPAARRLYEAAGFALAGQRKGYYRRSARAAVDALILRRALARETS